MTESVKLTKYQTEHGEVTLSPDIIRKYLVNGDPKNVTHQEVTMFLALCKYQKLNPFLREAHLIKYGNYPATMVTGKDVWTKRGAKNPDCAGWDAGITFRNAKGEINSRDGSMLLEDETLVGGWAKVYRKSWEVPIHVTVSLNEYQKFKDGKPTANWKTMPATMIRKVALVQALREAFPEDFEGLYAPEELGVDDSSLDNKPLEASIPENEPEEETIIDVETDEPDKEPTIDTDQVKALFKTAKGDKAIVREVIKNAGYKKASDVKENAYDGIFAEVEEAYNIKVGSKVESEASEEDHENLDQQIDPDGQLNFKEE